jgi:RNA polymerase sigma-B factor
MTDIDVRTKLRRPTTTEIEARSAELFAARDRAPDDTTRARIVDELVELHLPLAGWAASRYRTHSDDHLDVYQTACLGLVKAVQRFDPTNGTPFLGFAIPTVTGEVRRHFRDRTWDVRPPRRVQELGLMIDKAIDELTQSLAAVPTVAQVAEAVGADERDVIEAMDAAMNCRGACSTDAPARFEGTTTVGEALGDIDVAIETAPERITLHEALETLDERSRRTIDLYFNQGSTQRQIGQVLDLSQTQVCRVIAAALDHLRSKMDTGSLAF